MIRLARVVRQSNPLAASFLSRADDGSFLVFRDIWRHRLSFPCRRSLSLVDQFELPDTA